MGKRGRKSAAELAVSPVVQVQPRPEAPERLSDDEAAIWEELVLSVKPDFFGRSDLEHLALLCQHIDAARKLGEAIARGWKAESVTFEQMQKLLVMRERETRTALAVSRTLRLTKQAQVSPKGAHGHRDTDAPRPWEDDPRNSLAQCQVNQRLTSGMPESIDSIQRRKTNEAGRPEIY